MVRKNARRRRWATRRVVAVGDPAHLQQPQVRNCEAFEILDPSSWISRVTSLIRCIIVYCMLLSSHRGFMCIDVYCLVLYDSLLFVEGVGVPAT